MCHLTGSSLNLQAERRDQLRQEARQLAGHQREIGVELLAHDEEYPWFDPAVIEDIRSRRLLVWVNSETLTTGIPLFAGHDDEKAVGQSPSAAWSRLLDLGVDAVQTELPWLLRDLRTPFGGVKQSGVGREGGNFSREFFTEPKAVVMQIKR